MSEDIVTRLLESQFGGRSLCREAADEIQRLRQERLEWFLVACRLRDALIVSKQQLDEALDSYLRVRGRLEDPWESE